jgi:hypothetical protein
VKDLNTMIANLRVTCGNISKAARAAAAEQRAVPLPSINGDAAGVANLTATIRGEQAAKAARLDARAALYERRAAHLASGVIAIENIGDVEWNGLSAEVMQEARAQGRTVVDTGAVAPANDPAAQYHNYMAR